MAPRKGESNELKRFLLASKGTAVKNWLAGLRSKPELRKKFQKRLPDTHHLENLANIYDSLVDPISIPTKTGKLRAVRLKKRQRTGSGQPWR